MDQELIPYRYSSCCCCWSDALQKAPSFQSSLDEIQQNCSSRKYESTDSVGFLIRRHAFKMAVMTSARRLLLQQRSSAAR